MQSLNEFAREGASSVITALLTIFGATVAVFLVDVQLAFLSFLILPLLGIATKIFRNHRKSVMVYDIHEKYFEKSSKIFLSLCKLWKVCELRKIF